ncbi:MAG TPA: VIT1/CCC1 transporter family protein [Burkholderiales bacterium]|nr:VIT1/CCC1 transporter family protein [Burkholderiales bacterium]
MDTAESRLGELTSAYLYRLIAAREPEARKKRLFEELARDADAQALHWERQLRAQGIEPGPFSPDLRARLVGLLLRLLGPRRLTHALTAMKVRGMSVYRGSARAPRSAAALPSKHDEVGEQHRETGGGGSLRAAVFGVNDGLVSNASLILGVAGAGTDNAVILLTGVAGLLAGAFSMAAGEYVSVRSQREMYEYQIALEEAELAEYPEEEAGELSLIFQARGMAEDEARSYAQSLIADPTRALDTLTREELGLNPEDLGSPWGAGLSSFLSFAVGSAIPLAPFLLTRGTHALAASVTVAAAALFLVGAATSLFTGRSALRGGLRMLVIGAGAGALTFGIGRLLGVGLG